MLIEEAIKNNTHTKELKERPFFSIVIPCYNSGEYIGNLLQSIVDQNMSDDIEVILSDDHSTEPYLDKINEFADKLSIKMVETEYNWAPGNTREAGAKVAEGQWLCFADHDDEFIPNTLKDIKAEIEKNNEQYFAIANFYEVDPETNTILSEMVKTRNWNHAKFYNVDNLWKKFDIHFKKDLLSHEDIYISVSINCALQSINHEKPLFIDIFCYKWLYRPSSLSRKKYDNHEFLETFFKDYLDATGYVYLEQYEKGNISASYGVDAVIGVLLLSYFYSESFIFKYPKDYKFETFEYLKDFLIKCKETFGINNRYIWNYAAMNSAEFYVKQRRTAAICTGDFIPSRSFWDWLDYLHHDIINTNEIIHI